MVDGGDGIDQWSANYSAATSRHRGRPDCQFPFRVAGSLSGIERLGYAANLYSSFNTGSGNDTIDTTALQLNDYIYTNGGDDRVTLRSGSDTVDLGAGTDTLALRWGNATGDMYYGPALGDLTYGSFTVFGGSEVMSVGFTGVERFDIESGSGNDAFTTGNGDDTIRSGAGNDHVSSRGGGIVIDMGAGNDAWGFDYRGSTSNITIDILNNVILGLGASSVAGVEALRSNTGDSYAYTGDGNDTVVTGTGSQIDYLQTGARKRPRHRLQWHGLGPDGHRGRRR